MNEFTDGPFLIGVMAVVGLGSGFLAYKLTSGMSCGAKRMPLPENRGLPEPKQYPPMPKVPSARNEVFRGTVPPPAPPMRTREAMRQPPQPTSRFGYADPDYVVRDDLATSMLVAQATDSALLGYAAGGSMAGAMLGAAIAESEKRPPAPVYEPTSHEEVTYTAPEPSYSRCDDAPSYDSSSYSDSSSSSCGD